MRQKIAAGNWKMNKNYDEGLDLARQIAQAFIPYDVLVILGTPFIHLKAVADIIKGKSNLKLAAQNCHQEESGAYTGEVSVAMLKSVGADYVIIGHSERRQYFHESDELLLKKVKKTLEHGLLPIFCCGEPKEIREAEKHKEYVAFQLKNSIFKLDEANFSKIVIAYEPIWAIGTGLTATPAEAQDMHAFIRSMIKINYSPAVAEKTSILYGGSVNPGNARELFQNPDVDGGLVGGAALKADGFVDIANS